LNALNVNIPLRVFIPGGKRFIRNCKYVVVKWLKRGVNVQLEPGEKSFLAYFATSQAAQQAADELKKAELGTVQVDRISRYGVDLDAHYNNPINRAITISGPT